MTDLNKDPRDVILRPVVSEKSYGLIDEGKYTFLVDPRATKTEIKLAIEKIFGVKVAAGNTSNRVGKARRTRFGTGTRTDTKRALVVIERNDEITVKSVRNLSYVHVLSYDQLNAYDVLVSDDIVFTKAAYDAFVASKAGATEEVSA